mgnify:CR=1 FL=1
MKKLLILILIALLVALAGYIGIKGVSIGSFQILGITGIREKNEQLDESIGQATKLASTDYPKAISDTETDLKKLTEEKKNYEDMVTISTGDEVKQAIFDNGAIAIGILSPNEEILYTGDNWKLTEDKMDKNKIIEQINLKEINFY